MEELLGGSQYAVAENAGRCLHRNYQTTLYIQSRRTDGRIDNDGTQLSGAGSKEGRKGVHAYVGAPDYKGSLYYYISDGENEEPGYRVSDNYDAYEHQPPLEIYTRITSRGVNRWIDTKNVVDVRYSYVIENHLFKDTHIDLIYKDGEKLTVYSEYTDLINGLLRHSKKLLVKKVFTTMNEHFTKLRDSEREEERKFYPGKTAEEMFLGDDKYEYSN